MKPEAVVTPLQMGVPFGRRSPHVRGPYSMPNHINIENINFSDAVEAAAEQRAQAEMLVQTEKQKNEREKVLAETQVIKAKAEADSQLAIAKARAEGIRLQGEAEASAIKAKSDALQQSPNLVELTKAERWDGKLPTSFVPGSTIPFVNIK